MTSSPTISTAERRRFWRHHALIPLAGFVVLIGLFAATHLDLTLADHFYDHGGRGWIWGQSWWANELIHKMGRDLIALIGVSAIGVWIASFLAARARPWRRVSAYLVLCIGLGTGLVSVLKKSTNVDCPWDTSPFGGERPYVGLFADRPDGLPPGGCFPGGHSSGGFSLLAFYFIWRERRGPARWLGLALGLGLGTIFAFGQWVRGAHFASHDLWSACLCWFVALFLYIGPFGAQLWSIAPSAVPAAGEQEMGAER